MVVGVDQYKHIRKMAAEDGLSQREIARRLGISRNTVARYCKGEHMPWESAKRDRKPGVVNQDIERFIRSCLEHDKDPDVPKKQHHTARRIYERLVTEKGFTGGESTVRRWVNRIRDEAGEAYMPLHFALGEAAQADWGEVTFYSVAGLFEAERKQLLPLPWEGQILEIGEDDRKAENFPITI